MKNNQILNKQKEKLFKLSQLLDKGIIELDDIAEFVPGIMHINSRADLALEYMSKNGCDMLKYSNEELKELGASVLEKHQSEYTLKVTYPKLFEQLAKNDIDQIIPFFQDWQYDKRENPVFHFTTTKILNENQLISISLFPQQIEYFSKNINNLFGINKTIELYFERYSTLTKREKEILELLGKELTRKDISYKLFISERTVKKHCETIFKKLGTSKRTELEKIARAFHAF